MDQDNKHASILQSSPRANGISQRIQDLKLSSYQKYQKRMKIVNCLFIFSLSTNIILYFVHLYFVVKAVQNTDHEDCPV